MASLSFLGLRTQEFEAMKTLYAGAYGLVLLHEAPGVAWFALDDRAELHLYAETDDYHSFFGPGPVPGLFVGDDYSSTVARLSAAGVQWLTRPDTAGGRVWQHYRAPDGNVYEVMGNVGEG